MSINIPPHILNLKIGTSTSVDVLETLGRLFSEILGYLSEAGHSSHAPLHTVCASSLRKIERQLSRRGIIRTIDDLFSTPDDDFGETSLHSLSIAELERLYRQRQKRITARIADGLEPLTRHVESRIISELNTRKTIDISDRLKIDYCVLTHQLEMTRMANLLQLSYTVSSGPMPQPSLASSPDSILSHIQRLRSPRSIAEREALIETVDSAISLLRQPAEPQTLAPLAAELVELSRRQIIHIPDWISQYLTKAIRQWTRTPLVPDTHMVLPLLTSAISTGDWPLQRRAQRIINRCYRACLAGHPSPADRHTATTFSSYIPRFNPRLLYS